MLPSAFKDVFDLVLFNSLCLTLFPFWLDACLSFVVNWSPFFVSGFYSCFFLSSILFMYEYPFKLFFSNLNKKFSRDCLC
jgi:hypothetical protein